MIPDLIDDFIDAVDWDALSVWLQPLATVVTGLFALIAAIVAYRAVTRQIQANAKNVQAQIDANAKAVQDQIDATAAQQQKNREAEWARLRRQEVLDLVLDAGNMARRLASVARTYSFATDPELDHGPDDERLKDAAVKEFRELNAPDRLLVVMHKLKTSDRHLPFASSHDVSF